MRVIPLQPNKPNKLYKLNKLYKPYELNELNILHLVIASPSAEGRGNPDELHELYELNKLPVITTTSPHCHCEPCLIMARQYLVLISSGFAAVIDLPFELSTFSFVVDLAFGL